ncbi:helix-turn-helix domain-containing protein [Frisingicoccus sp.]|uniref:helix-turn-helix domain-containing protein n=1 Tax=Frisingicoccus sp. TaxID=1918627 RepID=UPI002E7A278B|nr:helix-turn-helix transcriptional regulator [Frisingicoccus sp.]MEE0751238.1 helix-turn-helix transcriptional regulator [Frisingicoccus sp.]
MNKMGTYIKRKRMERGLSVSELAQMIGVTEKKVEEWENDDGFPVIFRMEPLCTHLGCTVTQLLSGDDNANADALILELLRKVEKYKSLGIALIGLVMTQLSLNVRVAAGAIVGDFLRGLCMGISTGVTVAGVCLFAYGLSLFNKIRDKKEGN